MSLPSNGPHSTQVRAKLALATQLLKAGRPADAIARYADACFRLGIALEKLGDLRSAIVAYHRATELQPTLTEAWFRGLRR